MLADDILILYSKSTLYTISLDKYIQFTLSAGTYSIEYSNTKIKAAVLQQKQDLKVPQIKNLELAVLENYIFSTDDRFFIALDAPDTYLNK